MLNFTVSAAAPGLPIASPFNVYPRFYAAEPLPGLASRYASAKLAPAFDAAEQAATMNAVMAEIAAILNEGGAHAA